MSKSKKTSAAGAVAVKAEKAEAVAEVAVYNPDEDTSVAVRVDRANGTLWLNRAEIAALFGCSVENVRQHLANAEAEELAGLATCKDFLQVAADGKTRTVKAYNLDAVLSVGYRVKSPRGVAFRRWASCVLRERVAGAVAVPAPVAVPALADRVAVLERAVASLAVLKRENTALKAENARLTARVGEAECVVQDVGRIVSAAKSAAATLAEAAEVTEAAARAYGFIRPAAAVSSPSPFLTV